MQHFGQSPLPAYEPAFDWENERSMIFGQRIPETPISQYGISKYRRSVEFISHLVFPSSDSILIHSPLPCSFDWSQWIEDLCESSVPIISSWISW